MKVTVNGVRKEVADGLSVQGLLDALGLLKGRVAVELNREIIVRDAYSGAALKEGDVIEILSFVGGG